MTDLRRLGHELLREHHPDLEEHFYTDKYFLGKLVFANRIRKGLTQEELADKCNLPLKTIYKVEGASKEIDMDTYNGILEKLDVPAQEAHAKFRKTMDQVLEDYDKALRNLADR